jgi:hypothetical protein
VPNLKRFYDSYGVIISGRILASYKGFFEDIFLHGEIFEFP